MHQYYAVSSIQESVAHPDMISSPPANVLCQLLLVCITSPLSLKVVWCSTFELTVDIGQADGQINAHI